MFVWVFFFFFQEVEHKFLLVSYLLPHINSKCEIWADIQSIDFFRGRSVLGEWGGGAYCWREFCVSVVIRFDS